MTRAKPFGLTHSNSSNWDEKNVVPAFILNEASSPHDRIAYCWSVVAGLEQTAAVLLEGNNEVSAIASIFHRELEPLAKLLEYMADSGYAWAGPQEGGSA